MRLAIVILLFATAPALAQVKDGKDDKVTNDDPARPLQMPPASTEVKEAIDDFDRFQRRGAWERALKALYTIPEAQTLRFVDGEKGFIIPIERKRRTILGALPPDGQAACRLFYDAEAKKLLDAADGPSEQKNLERIFSAYFVTSVGDNAADRLGDLYFELGRFDRAADCWLAILRERPDTDLVAGPDRGEGRRGADPRGASIGVRPGPRRPGGPLRRRDGDHRRAKGDGGRAARSASSPTTRARERRSRQPRPPTRALTSPGRSTWPGSCDLPSRSRPA